MVEEKLTEARLAHSGRAAHSHTAATIMTCARRVLALIAGHELGEHDSPESDSASAARPRPSARQIHCGMGRPVITSSSCPRRHSLTAIDDSVVPLPVVAQQFPASLLSPLRRRLADVDTCLMPTFKALSAAGQGVTG